MKIGIDARLWQETGVGRYIRALIYNLSVLDRKNDYYLFFRRQEFGSLSFPQNFKKILADIPWHSLEEQLRLPKIYKRARLDLLHIPYFSVPLLTPLPFIFTLHDLTISHFATGRASSRLMPVYLIKRLGYKIVLDQAIRNSAKIIVPSRTVKQQLLTDYPKAAPKTTVIYEAGELETQTSHPDSDLHEKYLLYVGNAHPHKNLSALIHAFQKVIKDFPYLKLVLVGKKDFFYNRLLNQTEKLRFKGKIKVFYDLDNRALKNLYRNAQAFVFPSFSEGFGIPGLEAMWQKCPVIASDIVIFHEIYAQAAIYFNPMSADDLADKIKAVLTNKKLNSELKQKGLLQAGNYSWTKMAKETLNVYANCLGLRQN